MNSVLKKITKLLCCLIISLFIMGIGGEVVKADDTFKFGEKSSFTPIGSYKGSTVYTGAHSGTHHFKDNNGNDMFCLNSGADAPYGKTVALANNQYSDEQRMRLGAMIEEGSKLEGFTDDEKYFITQIAIWYDLAGRKAEKTTRRQDGLYEKTGEWLQKEENKKVRDAFNKVLDAADTVLSDPSDREKPTDYKLEIVKSNENSNDSTELKDRNYSYNGQDYMTSGGLKINTDVDSANFNIAINANSSEGACIVYNGACSTSQISIPKNAEFSIAVKKPSDASGTVMATIDVDPVTLPTISSVNVYKSVTAGNYQNMALLTTENIEISRTISLYGNYTNYTNVKLQKVDKEANPKVPVAGATLELYRVFDDNTKSKVDTYITETTATTVSLINGNYELVETKSPDAFVVNTTPVRFTVLDGVIKDANGNVISDATVSVEDVKSGVRFRKLDENGNPVAGAAFLIVDPTLMGAETAESAHNLGLKAYMCAMSDSDGYLTLPCDSTVTKSIPSSSYFPKTYSTVSTYDGATPKTGYYELGVDLGYSTTVRFQLVELYTNSNNINSTSVDSFNRNILAGAAYGLFIDENEVVTYSNDISFDQTTTDTGVTVTTFNFKNENRIDINISKSDITTGNEIAGAKLVVRDPSLESSVNYDEDKYIENIVDSWISESNTTHIIKGIIPDHIYELNEILAPEGYATIKTSIYFSMDEEGNVTTYEDATGSKKIDRKEIVNNEAYKMLVTNDVTKVVFSKTDAVTGEEVAGAHIKICTWDAHKRAGSEECGAVREWTSTNEPTSVEMLPTGKYVLIETIAPAGYVKQTSAVEFTVKDDNSIQEVEFKNTPTKLVIRKLDQVTKERIGGAKFQILDAETREIAKTADGVELVYETVADKDWEIYAIPAGKYILVETTYPENYQEGMIIDGIVTTEYEFTISDEEGDVNIDVGIEVLNAPSTGISTLNLFAIGGLMVFVGYETIKIYRKKTING